MDRVAVKAIVEQDRYLQSKLFCRGFLITDADHVDYSKYPFYGAWEVTALNSRYTIVRHRDLPLYVKVAGDVLVGIVGHAYDPISEQISEDDILSELIKAADEEGAFFEKINALTGVFCVFRVIGNRLMVLNDAVGLLSVFYGTMGNHTYISSHVNLIGDLLGLSEDPRITRLKACKTFHYFGNQLPGIATPFSQVKRLSPNHYILVENSVEQCRFYTPHVVGEADVTAKVTALLCKTMTLISQKWARPAISLTGGCDSKTTLACACDNYDKYTYFSYDSQKNERPDALAAAQICRALGLPHTFYKIPYEDADIENIEAIRAVLLWNGGNVRYNNANDVRKRAYLDRLDDFDVEVKSWASEIGRSRYTKRYNGRRKFGPVPTARKCTTFYKFLLMDRKAVAISDSFFSEYLQDYFVADEESPIPWQDQFYWEWHWPSRDGVCLTAEHMFSDEITVPYNNRYILELLLSVSEEDRICDAVYTRIREQMDHRIDKAAEAVVDVNHTNIRAICEDMYYIANNILP